MSGSEGGGRANVQHLCVASGGGKLERFRLRAEERPAVELHDPAHVRRLGPGDRDSLRDEAVEVVRDECVVEAALEADCRRGLRAHGLAAERAGDVAGIDLEAVSELREPAERMEEILGAFPRLDREVGAGDVTDEERVACQDEPRVGRP